MQEKCEICGANIALVGVAHNCRLESSPLVANPPEAVVNSPDLVATLVATEAERVANAIAEVANRPVEPLRASRHGKYADKEKRKEYMRQYMLKRRRRGK